MRLKHNKRIVLKISLALAALLVVVILVSGCVQGLQPQGWSGTAVSDGLLFIGTKEGRLASVRISDGLRQWSEPLKIPSAGGLGCAPSAGGAGGCSSAPAGVAIYGTPVVYKDLVYIAGYNGKVYAFAASSLQTRWVYPREDYLKPIVSGLTIANDTLYAACSDGRILALEPATGDKKWEAKLPDETWSTPAVEGNLLYIGSFDKKLYVLDAATGEKKWEFETGGSITAMPLVADNTVYIGSFDRYLYAINVGDHSLKWKFMGGNWFWARPVIYNNVVYAGCLDGRVYALDTRNGDKLAEFELDSPVASSPVIAGKAVVVAGQDGKIYSLDTASYTKRLLATLTVSANLGSPPAVYNGIVYVHTPDLNLHTINADTGAQLSTISLKKPE